MKKYLSVIGTTFNDSIQYAYSLIFRFMTFVIIMSVMVCLWSFIYGDGTGIINGYSYEQMIWYIILGEVVVFGSGSKVCTDDIVNDIKSGNIAYQVIKPYSYPIYIICKYYADTFIRLVMFTIISSIIGLLFVGPIPNFNIIILIKVIPIFLFAVFITGCVRILVSLTSFWVEDSKPFQFVYNKLILMFGVFFPIEMFPKAVGNILKFTPVYSVSYGPSKLALEFTNSLYLSVITSQLITIIIVLILIKIIYGKGVKKLNVNGG